MAVINLSVASALHIYQIEIPPQPPRRVSSFLVINQLVRINKIVFDFVEQLTVTQAATPTVNLNIHLKSQLGISQGIAPTKYLIASNTLTILQIGAHVNPQYTQNVLVISQNAQPSRATSNTLVLTEIVKPRLTLNRIATQSLILVSQAVSYISDVDFNPDIPATVLPTGVTYVCGNLTLSLKPPELGDSDKIEFNRIQRETRGGDLQIYSDPVWPKIETLKYTFKHLSRLESIKVLSFLEQSVGLNIVLTDYEGNIWNGIISTPAPDVTCESDQSCGSYSVTIEYQGVMA